MILIKKDFKIATVLPYKENYSHNKASAASLWVSEFYKNSKYKKKNFIYGNTKYKNYLKMTITYFDEMDTLNLPNQGWNRKKLKNLLHKEISLIENKTQVVIKKIIEQDKNIINKVFPNPIPKCDPTNAI